MTKRLTTEHKAKISAALKGRNVSAATRAKITGRPTTDLTGLRFGRLVAIERVPSSKPYVLWRCRCDCENVVVVPSSPLRHEKTRSCGCLLRETLRLPKTHGYASRAGRSKSIYNRWGQMVQRCANQHHSDYPRFGGRGINICNRWRHFESFLADIGEPLTPDHRFLIRLNKDGDYEPENVRWATKAEETASRVGRRRTRPSPRLLGKEEFVSRARAVHGDKYDYSRFEYRGMSVPGIIICPVHGHPPFSQQPGVHLHGSGKGSGSGCPRCRLDYLSQLLAGQPLPEATLRAAQTPEAKARRMASRMDFFYPGWRDELTRLEDIADRLKAAPPVK